MYRFYFNVDSGEFAQIYSGEKMSDEFCFDELERLAGVWSDCYMPICLGMNLFGKDVAFPLEMTDSFSKSWLVKDDRTSCIYPPQKDDMLFGHFFACKPINRTDNVVQI